MTIHLEGYTEVVMTHLGPQKSGLVLGSLVGGRRGAVEPVPDALSGLVADREQRDPRGFSELLAEHALTVSSERVSLGEIADFLGTRSIGAWLLILALPMVLPVPMPGISVLFGAPLIIISAQLALG
jgi:hypothetical protein